MFWQFCPFDFFRWNHLDFSTLPSGKNLQGALNFTEPWDSTRTRGMTRVTAVDQTLGVTNRRTGSISSGLFSARRKAKTSWGPITDRRDVRKLGKWNQPPWRYDGLVNSEYAEWSPRFTISDKLGGLNWIDGTGDLVVCHLPRCKEGWPADTSFSLV